jgi:hypothetical protein
VLLGRLLPRDAEQGELIVTMAGMNVDREFSSRTEWANLFVREKNLTIPPAGEMTYRGRMDRYGQQLRRSSSGSHVAVFEFRDQKLAGGRSTYAFELRTSVERLEEGEASRLSLKFVNRRASERPVTRTLYVESNRPAFVSVPEAAVKGGDFDVVVTPLSEIVLDLRAGRNSSLKLVRGDESFAWNLLKSLTVLWLMTLLVIVVAVFASTFVSWPIAVVLTVVILCGHWGAEQVADLSAPGIGRQIVNDMMRNADPASAKAVEQSVDALAAMLRTVSAVLPDISRYAALSDIQQGVAISVPGVLLPSLEVTLLFGLPLLVLAYVFLKFKEVAP